MISMQKNSQLRTSIALGVGTGLIYLACLAPVIWNKDGNGMLEVAISLVKHQNFRVSPSMGALGVDGYYYSMWYPLQSILAVPLVAIGLWLSQIFHLPEGYMAGAFALLLPPLYTAVTTALVVLLAFRLGSDRQGAYIAALSYAFCTISSAYAREFYPEPLIAVLVILSVYLIFGKSDRSKIIGSFTAGLAILAKPSTIVLGPLLSVYLFLKKQPPTIAIAPLISTGVFAGIYGVYNFVRFGNPMSFGQSWMTTAANEILAAPVSAKDGNHLTEGLLGMIISPGRGIIWYSPCVLLGFVGFFYAYKSKLYESLLIIGFSLVFLVINSGAWWTGAWSWGPRYLLPTFPLLLSLAALVTKRWRLALITLATIGFLVNAPNLVSFYTRYYIEAGEQQVSIQDTLWSFDRAPFRQSWSLAKIQINDGIQHDVRAVFKKARKYESKGAMSHIVPLWWWMLPLAGIPQWIGALVAVAIASLGVWTIGSELILRS
jgi:hypothetical protein